MVIDSGLLVYMIGISEVHMFQILGIIYIVSAILLASNKFIGLVTVILSAIVFNILLFHLTLDLAGIPPALVFTVLLANLDIELHAIVRVIGIRRVIREDAIDLALQLTWFVVLVLHSPW